MTVALGVSMFGRWILWIVIFHFLILAPAFGETEEASATEFSSSAMPIEMVRSTPIPHPYARVQRLDAALYLSIAGYRAMDYVSTRRALGAGARETQLPQWVVDSPPAFLAFEGLSTAVEAGTSVWLIRHGHWQMARTFNAVSISLGTRNVLHNYAVFSKQQQQTGLIAKQ